MQVDEPHPLPILNISEHLTRRKLQTRIVHPFIIGALLGTQNGREVEIVNTFELALDTPSTGHGEYVIDHAFLVSRRDQYKQVFPSLEFIGWYSVAPVPTSVHIALHHQFSAYSSTPLLLLLHPEARSSGDADAQALPLKAYEPTLEIRDRKSRAVYVEAPFNVETGEAERIAVDWTSKGGTGGTSLISYLQTQRAAIKMLHDRIMVLVHYLTSVSTGDSQPDHAAMRSLAALVASLPASESMEFRDEFEMEYADVHITAFLTTLTKAANNLNNLVDKHLAATAGRDGAPPGGGGLRPRRGMAGRMGIGMEWESARFHP